MAPAIFIAATGQHVGKTTTCLGLVGGLKKLVGKVGFIKPVGQKHIEVTQGERVDMDVDLIRSEFKLDHLRYRDMSPIVFDSMYTRDFLDSGPSGLGDLKCTIKESFESVSEASDYTVVEGTGHMGVGSIVGLNNATVAKLLNVDVVLVASGGVGSAFDEIALNLQLCQAIGVGVRGVILNKVQPDKMAMVAYYISKALVGWKVPLLGCIPFSPTLAAPSLFNLQKALHAQILSGEHECDKLLTERLLVATRSDIYYEMLHAKHCSPSTLVITPAARSDIIHATIVDWADNPESRGALMLTGSRPPSAEVQLLLKRANIPALYSDRPTLQVAHLVSEFTPKTAAVDKSRIQCAVKLVEESIDFNDFL